jgi:hypothetical protein
MVDSAKKTGTLLVFLLIAGTVIWLKYEPPAVPAEPDKELVESPEFRRAQDATEVMQRLSEALKAKSDELSKPVPAPATPNSLNSEEEI